MISTMAASLPAKGPFLITGRNLRLSPGFLVSHGLGSLTGQTADLDESLEAGGL